MIINAAFKNACAEPVTMPGVYSKTCSQCGEPFSARACGFAHAEIQAVTVPWSAPRGGGRPGRARRVRTAERLVKARYLESSVESDMAHWCLREGMVKRLTGRWPEDHAAEIAESLALGGWTWDGRRIP